MKTNMVAASYQVKSDINTRKSFKSYVLRNDEKSKNKIIA